MVHLSGNFYADCSRMGATLEELKGEKNGEKNFKILGYYTTFRECVEGASHFLVMDKLSEKDMDFQEAVSIVRETYEQFRESLMENIPVFSSYLKDTMPEVVDDCFFGEDTWKLEEEFVENDDREEDIPEE